MNCPNCNFDFNFADGVCPNCGYDAEMNSKMNNYSNIYYNKGLRHAKSGDLTNAIEALLKSVAFNKKNINAQNLLGLVYYEVGLIGNALKHWVLSVAAQNENNSANEYLDAFQRDTRRLEQYGDSLKMYNLALNYLKQKSEDMAIIQLKKAIEYNPNFVDAMNLLVLCYFLAKQRSKAVPLIDRVLEIDVSNPIAMNYLNELSPGKKRTKQVTASSAAEKSGREIVSKSSPTPFYVPNKPIEVSHVGFPLTQLVCLIIGAIAAACVMYVFIIPPKMAAKDSEIEAIVSEQTNIEAAYTVQLSAKDIEIAKINNEKNELSLKIEELNKKTELQDRVQQAQSVSNYYSQGKYIEALSVIDSINTEGMPDTTISMLTEIKENCYKTLGETNFADAKANYNSANYSQAKEQFEESLKYVLPDSSYTGDAYYFLGRIAEVSNELELALEYFIQTADNYPNAANYDRAVNKVKALS